MKGYPVTSGLECTRCVMRSEDDPNLEVVDGICNHCRRYQALLPTRVLSGAEGERAVTELVSAMRAARSKDGYDCLIGVSGGVDSTFVAREVVRRGLRPLAIHVDNGWNSETAVGNISKTLDALGIDLYTEVLDLREFYDLQRAFLLANTPDGDVPADHAIQAMMWKVARKFGIRYIVSGMNFRTEAISVPEWSYGHSDWRYLRDVHRRLGRRKLRTYPHFGFTELLYTNVMRRVRIVSILNYIDYDKSAALQVLKDELGWEAYGGKHFESIYTRFYQGYVLPTKFGIDKRRGHLSDLINSGQMTREQALEELATDDYDERLRRRDEELFLKKLALTTDQFREIMNAPVASFRDYKNSYVFINRLKRTVNRLRRAGLYPR